MHFKEKSGRTIKFFYGTHSWANQVFHFCLISALSILLSFTTPLLPALNSLVPHIPMTRGIPKHPEIRFVHSDGSEDIESLFRKAKCIECHVIPGIRGANGTVGPRLVMGTTGPKHLKDLDYKGDAKTVKEYVVESILDHSRYVPKWYRSIPMPLNYRTALAAGALQEMVEYLAALETNKLRPTPLDPCTSKKLPSKKQTSAEMQPGLPSC